MERKDLKRKKAGEPGRKTERGQKRNQTRKHVRLGLLLAIFGLFLFIVFIISRQRTTMPTSDPTGLSEAVLAYRDTVESYAEENGIEKYTEYLLAIMQIESGGRGDDVMQSSESLGLPPNSLSSEESVAQGCAYFAEILDDADRKGCDLDAVIQSYNFGIDYLDFVSERGGDSDLDMATEFAEWKSGGETVPYSSELAEEVNGGWRYKYGNMFYAELVKKIVRNLEE